MYEDASRNRLIETLDLFEQVSNSKWLRTTPVILFLNKRDLFAQKIKSISMNTLFPDYTGTCDIFRWFVLVLTVKLSTTGGSDFEAGRKFLTAQFVKRIHIAKDVFVHVTCATDTHNIQFVFEAVRDIVTSDNVAGAGF